MAKRTRQDDQPSATIFTDAPRTEVRSEPPYGGGYAVRRDWPDGSHDFYCFAVDTNEPTRKIVRDEQYWKRGPMRPTRWMVVDISINDFDLHRGRHLCKAPDCPNSLGGAE